MKKLVLLLLLAGTIGLIFAPASAQTNEEPVAYAVLFHLYTCPHCRELIENQLPPIREEFGDQLQILDFELSSEGGQSLSRSAYAYYNIPREDWVVPMMIINDEVLIGGVEIPTRLPEIVRTGLADGGIPLPQFPGMAEAYTEFMASQGPIFVETSAADLSLVERLTSDPANILAVGVLVALVASLAYILLVGIGMNRRQMAMLDKISYPVVVALAILTGLLAFSLLLDGGGGDAYSAPIAVGIVLGLAAVTIFLIVDRRLMTRAIPIVALVGLGDAFYLTYIEMTQNTAVCGLIGNCNLVQQSPYAMVFGVLPMGALGLMGYLIILMFWAFTRSQNRQTRNLAYRNLIIAALFGGVFSIYLTFLEPFVIGATCLWCLVSALTMLIILWLVAVPGWHGLYASSMVERRQHEEAAI